MNGGRGFTGQSPCAAWMSVWQSPVVSTRTRISCAPGTGFDGHYGGGFISPQSKQWLQSKGWWPLNAAWVVVWSGEK